MPRFSGSSELCSSAPAIASMRSTADRRPDNEYDAVLLDLMMPTEGGVTVVKHLRKENPALLTRVLLLTATPESVLKNIERGVAGVVRKPFTNEELLGAVKRVSKS